MKALILFIAFAAVSICVRAEHYVNKFFGFELTIPAGWHSMDENQTLENIKDYDFSDAQLEEVFRSNAGSMHLLMLAKYDPATYPGLIPTIKVEARKTSVSSLDQTCDEVTRWLDQAAKAFTGFRYEQPCTQTDLKGRAAVTARVRYDIPVKGTSLPVRSCSYFVLRRGYILTITVSGAEDDEVQRLCDAVKYSVTLHETPPPGRHARGRTR